jgi:hypothetical protein
LRQLQLASATRTAGNYMRFNVAQSRSTRLFTVLEKAFSSR